MMLLLAESIVAFLVHEIGSSIVEEVNFLRGVRNQVHCLRIRLRYLQSALDDGCDKKSSTSKGNALLRIHGEEIRKLAVEIGKVVDSYALIFSQSQRYVFRPCTLVRVHRIGVKVEQIQRRIQEAMNALNDLQSLASANDDDDQEQRSSSSDMRSRL